MYTQKQLANMRFDHLGWIGGYDFDDHDLRSVNFDNGRLSHSSLQNADMRAISANDSSFALSKLNNADLSYIKADRAYFFKAHLCNVTAIGGHFNRASFESANLTNADFTRANLTNANLEATELTNTDFTDADLNGVSLIAARFCNTTLTNVKGLGNKAREIELAKELLSCYEEYGWQSVIEKPYPDEYFNHLHAWYYGFISKTRKHLERGSYVPTLSQYFLEPGEVGLAALKRVAAGIESVWNDDYSIYDFKNLG